MLHSKTFLALTSLLIALSCGPKVPAHTSGGTLAAGDTLEGRLRQHVQVLAGDIGPRSLQRPKQLHAARDYIRKQWEGMGYSVQIESYECSAGTAENLFVEIAGTSKTWLIVGAHYDSCNDTPGADDNASGVAALLELSRKLHGKKLQHPLRMIAFANEEPPWFQTEDMGSLVHATACLEREDELLGMIALEMLGCYRDEAGSQEYPVAALAKLYPKEGNFLAFVTDMGSAKFMTRPFEVFKKSGLLPTQALSAPQALTGIGFSDHWSFWRMGYQAFMVTDTAFFRNPHYHESSDKPATLDYQRFTKAVQGLELVLADFLSAPD
jgi:Peptidase family M28